MFTEKRCYGCKTTKPLDSFHRNRRERDGRAQLCRPCSKIERVRRKREFPGVDAARAKAWRESHPERCLEYEAKKLVKDPDRSKNQSVKWRTANRAYEQLMGKIKYQANAEKNRAVKRALYAADPKKAAKRKRDYNRANPNRKRTSESSARRRALKIGTRADPVDYDLVLLVYGMNCHICEKSIGTKKDLHFDHVIALSRGGEHTQENVKPAHARCNMRKYTSPIEVARGRIEKEPYT